jgi:hypothetical protein
MDDAGDAAPAAAMGMMIVYVNLVVRMSSALVTRTLRRRGEPREQPLAEIAAT